MSILPWLLRLLPRLKTPSSSWVALLTNTSVSRTRLYQRAASMDACLCLILVSVCCAPRLASVLVQDPRFRIDHMQCIDNSVYVTAFLLCWTISFRMSLLGKGCGHNRSHAVQIRWSTPGAKSMYRKQFFAVQGDL